MAKKTSTRDPFTEFIKILERQRMEMEKIAKPFFEYPKRMEKMVKPFIDYQRTTEKMTQPILDYHQKLLEESKKFQDVWVHNVVETIGKVVNQMVEEQRKKTEEANKLLSEVNVPTQVKEYLQSLQRIQERWVEQQKKTTEVMENFVKKKNQIWRRRYENVTGSSSGSNTIRTQVGYHSEPSYVWKRIIELIWPLRTYSPPFLL
jgi:Ni,Fe-hydrogenase I large subunit